jgi:RNA polymerase sigma factor (sigma-70 family)
MDLTRFFAEHHASLYRYLVRFTGDADLAADGAQEAFARLVERPPPTVERAWLFRVATNAVMEAARTGRRRGRLLAERPGHVPVAEPPPDPHARVVAIEERALVTRALAALSEKERTALLMREEGCTHREIAAAVGTTTGAVGTLLARALDKLAARLQPRLETAEGRR